VSYRLRVQEPGIYHVGARGNNKRLIFLNRNDRILFLEALERISVKHAWTIHAYCLMRNHYHLVMGVGERGMSGGLCELNTAYALQFNRRHGRVNHLFGRRYWSDKLETDQRFLNTVRYVIQNPLRAGWKRSLERYEWSSYRSTLDLSFSPVTVEKDYVLTQFGPTPAAAREQFVDFCTTLVPKGQDGWQPP
jgi:putative transposase